MSEVTSAQDDHQGPWSEVVGFGYPDGSVHPLPPGDRRAYRTVVMPGMLAPFEELCRSGRFYRFVTAAGGAVAVQPWREVFGLPASPAYVTTDDAEQAFRRLAFDAHPDRGGSHEKMVALSLALDAARRDLGVAG